MQDISNVSPWSQITAQFNLFNSGSDSNPSASTAGRRLLQTNNSFADFAPQDTTTSDLTKEGVACHHLRNQASYQEAITGLQACILHYTMYSIKQTTVQCL